MESNRTLFLVMACFMVLASACATMQPQYHVNIDSISQARSETKKSYILLPGNKDTNAEDLQFREYAGYVDRALASRGFFRAERPEQADIAVFLSYGIGDPETHQYTYSLPVWGQTGVSSSTTYGTLKTYGGFGSYSGATTYTPTYGITGHTSHIGEYTTYFRFILLDAYDLDTHKSQSKLVQVWRSTVTSSGSSGDLRRAFPVLVAASAQYLGANTGQAVGVTLDETNPAVLQIKGDASKQK